MVADVQDNYRLVIVVDGIKNLYIQLAGDLLVVARPSVR